MFHVFPTKWIFTSLNIQYVAIPNTISCRSYVKTVLPFHVDAKYLFSPSSRTLQRSLNCGESTRPRLITKVNQGLNHLGRWKGKKEKIEVGELPEDLIIYAASSAYRVVQGISWTCNRVVSNRYANLRNRNRSERSSDNDGNNHRSHCFGCNREQWPTARVFNEENVLITKITNFFTSFAFLSPEYIEERTVAQTKNTFSTFVVRQIKHQRYYPCKDAAIFP